MSPKKHRIFLTIGVVLYLIFATSDTFLTLRGIQGDPSLEGNPAIRWMMTSFGLFPGLVIQKMLILILLLCITSKAVDGIRQDADWIYALTLTRYSLIWMKKKKRYGLAFLPLYMVALAQGIAAGSWILLFN